jgi:hypothetical protein
VADATTDAPARLYTWCLETRLPAALTAEAMSAATAAFVGAGGARVWLLDASGVDAVAELDDDVLGEVRKVLEYLLGHGLACAAVVAPSPVVRAVVEGKTAGLAVRTFATRAAAVAWLKGGCR